MWLSIDCTKSPATFLLWKDFGKGASTLAHLPEDETKACALWLGRVGGKRLLDAFELALIQAGRVRINVHDSDGNYYGGHWECQDVEPLDAGYLLFWERKCTCENCSGSGHHAQAGELVQEEHICTLCEGSGLRHDTNAITDMDGLLIDPPSLN